ncbi:hypothetical protein BP5796_03504 [Coleophoma crateriformis]|uniref:Serine/threonine-protein kinase ATG1 n=1 Tax=Coleophoma crateriformis TaxID=565419 RepID=A0A3D8SND9_9HELO|nr:hypothetical protein BP5796_03504 [Coleophoma crateriformis]
MSSAALQAAPHQPTSLGSQSPVAASSSGRPYTAGSSQSRDPYYNQNPPNASPSSARRASRRPSGNGASASNNLPHQQQQQYYSPTPTAGLGTSRSASAASQAASAAVVAATPSGYPAMSPGDHQRGVPPVVSPRTSSNRSGAERRESTRKTGYADGQSDRRRDNGQTNGTDAAVAAANAATRSRRKAQDSPGDALPHRSASNRESTRSQPAATTPTGPSREASEVLNRMIVSKPEVDLDRERERMAEAVPASPVADSHQSAMGMISTETPEDAPRGARSRHDHSASAGKREKNSRFGEYFLGNTLGEGEFGKVKMGWKQEGGVQVAIKLIRRDTVGSNPQRLAKIYREIAILREISHPNIVQLHEMVETEKHIGIILEYASGGELFDYILNHRYLKDNAARRLFAQLVSGVGYLHKKGIVHRDLKLENLLLDRNRNIIITDFGFANTFNPEDELGEEIESNLIDRDYVKRMDLNKILPSGSRRGDLMQTSCGSPCYAAPELVVSDSLYTGRKVDVWSCGVILYAMLAGYLPFDDDPANPEGDNINLLYKYIVSTPLTFPEYVTPHARDLLRRILVPDPRKRADLFEVARHSWLSEYSHVVGFITSSATTSADIGSATVGLEEEHGAPLLARSASVREASKSQKAPAAVGDLARKHGGVDAEESYPKPQKDNKRRTVQVEYVAPRSQTQRGETSVPPSGSKTRARAGSNGPVEVPAGQQASRRPSTSEKPLPQDPPGSRGAETQYAQGRRASGSQQRSQGMAPPARSGREAPRAVSDANYMQAPPSLARPATGNSMGSAASRSGSMALPSRGSYGQPAAPAVAGTNVHGRMAQPSRGKSYNSSTPASPDEISTDYGQPSITKVPSKFAKVSGHGQANQSSEHKSHKRSSTIGGIFSRTNSIFGKSDKGQEKAEKPEKSKKSYPPVSMNSTRQAATGGDTPSRQSIDSRRSTSFGFNKKRSGSITGSQTTLQEKPRRFSLLPASFSLKSIGIGKEYGNAGTPSEDGYDRPDSRNDYLDQPQSGRGESRNISGSTAGPQQSGDGGYDRNRDSPHQDRRGASTASPQQHHRYGSQAQTHNSHVLPPTNFRQGESTLNNESESSSNEQRRQYPAGFNEYDDGRSNNNRGGRGVLQKNNRRFADAYDEGNYGGTHDNAGSSGAARKVMDFFRRRGRARESDR